MGYKKENIVIMRKQINIMLYSHRYIRLKVTQENVRD